MNFHFPIIDNRDRVFTSPLDVITDREVTDAQEWAIDRADGFTFKLKDSIGWHILGEGPTESEMIHDAFYNFLETRTGQDRFFDDVHTLREFLGQNEDDEEVAAMVDRKMDLLKKVTQ